MSTTITKVSLEYDDEVFSLEGKDAEKWKEATDSLANIGLTHNYRFPELPWKHSKSTEIEVSTEDFVLSESAADEKNILKFLFWKYLTAKDRIEALIDSGILKKVFVAVLPQGIESTAIDNSTLEQRSKLWEFTLKYVPENIRSQYENKIYKKDLNNTENKEKFEYWDCDTKCSKKQLGELLQALIVSGGSIVSYELELAGYKQSPLHCVPLGLRIRLPRGKKSEVEKSSGCKLKKPLYVEVND